MIDIDIERTPELYTDYKKCLSFLQTIDDEDYEYPNELTYFHVYSEFKNEREFLALKSFFATQNLDHCELVVWSDWDISNDPLIAPYKDLALFNVYDPYSEAIGTPLENHSHLTARDSLHYMQSDLLRILLLWKYGGVWFDMDMVLLRDFKPILDQDYMHMWGIYTDFANDGAMASVVAGRKGSEFSKIFMEELINTPQTHETINGSTCWSKNLFATMYQKNKYTIFPATFFNTEMHMPEGCVELESQWWGKPLEDLDQLFLETFAWHWHNGGGRLVVNEMCEGSKYDLLNKLTDKRLKEKGIL